MMYISVVEVLDRSIITKPPVEGQGSATKKCVFDNNCMHYKDNLRPSTRIGTQASKIK